MYLTSNNISIKSKNIIESDDTIIQCICLILLIFYAYYYWCLTFIGFLENSKFFERSFLMTYNLVQLVKGLNERIKIKVFNFFLINWTIDWTH